MKRADLLDYGLHAALGALPVRAASDVGARLAPLMGRRQHPGQHERAMRLFARLRPDWAAEPGGTEAAVDRLWANIGRTFAEFSVSHRMLRSGRVAERDAARFEAAAASGRPLIGVFPHLGNWELSEMQIGFRVPHRGAVIVAPPASDARSRIAERVRRQAPAALLPMSPTVWKQAIAQLKKPGGGLMLAVDEFAAGQVMGPSLGRPPRLDGNLGKAARLALMTNALVLPFYNERLPGARFLTHYLPVLEFAGRASDEGAVAAGVARIEEALQPAILRLLDQWYMALNFGD